MKYLLMIYTEEAAAAKLSPAEAHDELQAYMAYTGNTQKSGVYVAGEALHPTSTATSVRVRGGKTTTIDGPFAETKEQLGGYYLLDCKNLDEAIEWAAKIPHSTSGCIEVRPIVDFSQMATA